MINTTTRQSSGSTLSPFKMEELKARYSEPQRHYHTWAHIEALLGHYSAIEPKLAAPAAVLFAIYYHDAIYEPLSATNEEESAALMQSAHPDAPALAQSFIRATKAHLIPDNLNTEDRSDCGYFLDMDISILGSETKVYDEYAAAIRREYSVVPEEMYRAGRQKILNSFLERTPIYFTDYFREKLEARARDNLARELVTLSESVS